jgi:hypothetical protein
MTVFDWVDFVRVAGTLTLLFLALPLLARRLGDRARQAWYLDVAPSFVYASVFFQITTLILGNWQLCYSGLMAILILCWLAATIAFASSQRWIWDAEAWRGGFLRTLEWFEKKSWKNLAERCANTRQVLAITQTVVIFGVWLGIVFLDRAAFALENLRFIGSQTYERALSLQTLVNGGRWPQDGSTALLAPIAHFSGADGATVVRLTGPIFMMLLVLAGGYCAWVYSRRLSGTFLAALLLGIYPATLGFDSPGEAAGPELAAVYWVLALALARDHWRYAAASAATAFLIHSQFTPLLAGTILCVSAAIVFSAAAGFLPRILTAPAALASILLGGALLIGAEEPPPPGPYQYESAARSAYRIGREYPRNKWMIVSPAQELASTYGRGWHVQVSEFVRDHTPEMVAQPDFRFRYPVEHLFIFIEKEPLRQSARGSAMAADDYSFRYFTQTGRTSLQFLTAQIMAAYCSSHDDAQPYFEDDQFVVYRVSLTRSNT